MVPDDLYLDDEDCVHTYPEPEAMPDRTPPGAMTGLRGKATWCEVVDEAQEWFDYWMRLWADEILMQGEVSR